MSASGQATSVRPRPLEGRRVLVTGVSRRRGIGYAISCRAADLGASVAVHHFSPHDAAQAWGADALDAVIEGVRAHLVPGAELVDLSADLADAAQPRRVVETACEGLGGLDGLVCNHAASGHDGRLESIAPEDLDLHWRVNARGSLLLVQTFAEVFEPSACRELSGAVVLMTSGQGLGPMPDEIAYSTSKAALAGITPTLADGLASRGIRLNTVNPGPVDTGYMDDALRDAVRSSFPAGRLSTPDDPARLICWLLSDEARWVTGQVISTEGGFRR
ncbi:SDR family oxidoreductase [Actinomyces haliotis]|uniref:SDR family oxidoreductase n=1 Tax=Actinomyces haliotis TaxID=1280843 RepID=UPI00188DD06C|nr:SDR family oxidoreductase [Actinomyces haliotis]